MFAYCNNNPVNCIDPTGDIPVLDAYIHQEVLKEICDGNSALSYKQTYIRYRDENMEYTGRWGFCDLYNKNTGEVWELKKNSKSRSCRTDKALEQLGNYVNGTLLWHPDLKLQKPYITEIPSDRFTIEGTYITYNVNYWDEGNGILRYDYSVSIDVKNVVQTACIIGICVIGGYAAMGIGGAIGGAAGGGALLPA